MDVPNPVADAEALLERLEAAEQGSADQARAALAAARADAAGRSVGLAIIEARPLYQGGDWQEFEVAISDGERDAAILARLAGSAVAVLEARGEDKEAHLLERMRRAVGTLPNDGHRYENVILNHPRTYTV